MLMLLFGRSNVPFSVALALPAGHRASVIPLDGSGDSFAVLARAYSDTSWTDTDSHTRISSIAVFITVVIATNLHVDASLSDLKALSVGGGGSGW
jgi:hypothetical protein